MANMPESFDDDFEGIAYRSLANGIAPVLINQVLSSGTKYRKVCVLGIVRHIDISSTKVVYTLEDSTGRIEVHYWLDEGNELKAPDILRNKYVIVYGSVKQHDGRIIVTVYEMLPISDPNVMVTHNLEVIGHFCK